MVFVLVVPFFFMRAASVGGEELKWRHPAHNQLWSKQGPHFSPHCTAKTIDKSTFLRKKVSSGISDVVIASVPFEEVDEKDYY